MTRLLPAAFAIGLGIGLAGCTAARQLAPNASVSGSVAGTYGYGVTADTTVLTRLEGNAGANSGDLGSSRCSGVFAGRYRRDTSLEPDAYQSAEIRDLSVTCRSDQWLVSVGRQAVVWGKVDGFRVLDLVHPFDYREFVLDDPNSSRVPLAMARLERRTPGNGFVQLLLVPEHREDILPAAGAHFSGVYPPGSLGLGAIAVTSDPPRWGAPEDWEYGAKWEQNARNIGYTLNVLTKLSTSPTYVVPGDGTVQARFHRQQVYGGSVDFPWGPFVLRAEAAYSPDVFQPSGSPPLVDYERYRLLSSAFGIENQFGAWFVGAQLLHDSYLGTKVPPRQDGAGSERSRDLATLLVTRSFSQDRTKLRLFLVQDLRASGRWVQASVSRDLGRAVELKLSTDYLAGRPVSVLGRIGHEDRVLLQVQVSR